MIFSIQALAILLNSFVVMGSQHPYELNSLKNVYSSEQLQVHDIINVDSFLPSEELKRRRLQDTSITNERKNLYITCTSLEKGIEIQSYLVQQLQEYYVHPVFVSRSANSVCFATFMKPSTAANIQELPNIQSCVKIPPTLKIHNLVMGSFGLVMADSSIYHKPKLTDFSNTKLVIYGGVGVLGKIPQTNDFISLEELKNLLSSNPNPIEYIESLINEISDVAHRPKNLWTNLLEQLKKSSISCSFSTLSIESSSNNLVIGNLKQFLQSSDDSSACSASLLAILVQQQGVADIKFRLPKQKFNKNGKHIVQTKNFTATTFPYTNAGIDGTGQVVGIGDTGVDELSCFFRNSDGSKVARSSYTNPTYDLTKRKVIQYINYADDTDTLGGHGTHVSGTVAGNLIGSVTTYQDENGHASGAKIAFFDMEYSSHPEYGILYPSPLGDNVFRPAYNAGARLHSNSWGSGLNFYDDDVLSLDSFSYDNVDFLALFAASNDGSEGYYSIGSPAVSKNALTVGATRSSSASTINSVAFFSSIGPTFDNRIKPDIVAPGYYTWSAKASGTTSTQTCEIEQMAGTSMATPATAGVAAQIRSYFAQKKSSRCNYLSAYNFPLPDCSNLTNPKGATVKALVIHSGEPITLYDSESRDTVEPTATLSTVPDMYQGFGRVSLQNILPYPGIQETLNLIVIENSIQPDYLISHTISVPSSTLPLKATLVWMDPENSALSTKMLINDLDLKIVRVSTGTEYFGNNIQGDEYNNVEQVTIKNPVADTYTISLISSSYLSTVSQSFTLIITGAGITMSQVKITNSFTICSSNKYLTYMTLMDHDGDGWNTGNSVKVNSASGSLIYSGTMSGSVGDDSIKQISLCLDEGEYTASLITNGDDADEMGFEVDDKLFLSQFRKSGTFSISNTNACTNPLILTLQGSVWGIPYGWDDDTHYTLKQVDGGNTQYKGTLVTGIFRNHPYCLDDGTWELTLNDVPLSDDFLDDDYLASYFGVEEYAISFQSGSLTGGIDKTLKLSITYLNGAPTNMIISNYTSSGNNDKDDDDDDITPGAAAAIALAVIFIVVMIGCGGFCYFKYKNKQSSTNHEAEITTNPVNKA
mmetsp:Transcript_14029/g.14643  ORF Transcript_14029/g.14643 Transcript_14029/m.14643 type:complete len:1100 (-) Transcript_14029:260-3559(-)